MPIWKQRSNQGPKISGPFPDLISRILSSQNIKPDQIQNLLYPQLGELKDPFSLMGMKLACDRLVQAFLKKEKICIYADFDLDGTSGLAILKTGLEKIGFQDVAYYQPRRLSEGYGFHAEAVEELHHLGISLILTVDVGITSFKAFEKAKQLGVDVILTDHHLPAETLPKAFVVVNPNQKDCKSNLGYLCGAGVAFYLLRALKRSFYEHPELPKNEWDLKDVLEYFCIGTLTDMVPLIDDNRVLVKHGLIALAQTQKAGLKALLEALSLSGRDLTSQDVAIRYSPKLNALSRMESEILPVQIFLETNHQKAQQMVHQVLEQNQNRQNLQSEAEAKALKALENWSEPDFVFVSSEYFHRGIIGLIATKLTQIFNRPAFVGSQNSEGMIVGSSRTPQGSEVSLVEALKSCEKFLNRFGGHAAAAGFELHLQNQNQMIECLKNYFIQIKTNPQNLQIEFDTTAELDEVNAQAMKWHDFIGPYGVGFHVPLIQFTEVKIASLKDLKGGHLKLNLTNLNQTQKIDGLLFSPSEKLKSQIEVGKKYNILAEIQWNYFNQLKTIQLLVKDLKII